MFFEIIEKYVRACASSFFEASGTPKLYQRSSFEHARAAFSGLRDAEVASKLASTSLFEAPRLRSGLEEHFREAQSAKTLFFLRNSMVFEEPASAKAGQS